jgi:hypothetical protein
MQSAAVQAFGCGDEWLVRKAGPKSTNNEVKTMKHRNEALFAACCLFVMAVSVHDAMLVILNDVVICDVEHNPIGRWLIELQDGEVWLFVLVKLVGTSVACAALVTLYRVRADLALAVSKGVALFQAVLLCYLTFECPR